MMLSHPVLLGLLWSLVLVSSAQQQISNNESNKVYSYTYHFQHNGTTNSKEIIQNVLGNSAFDGTSDGQSIVKTFSNPNIRGFFTKGILPAGPLSSYSNFGSTGFNTNKALDDIKNIVQNNLQPPKREIITGLLPVSPDIPNQYPAVFNNVNQVGNVFQNQDFPKIPPPPPQPVIPSINNNNNNNNNVVSRVQSYSRDTPDGGKIVGKIVAYAYNPPPVTNSVSKFEEDSQGYRQNENLVNNHGITGHRTQSYFRQHFRTITPDVNLGFNNNFPQNNAIHNKLGEVNNNPNNNNNWWNVLNENNANNQGLNQHVNRHTPHRSSLNQYVRNDISTRLNDIVFGRRLNNNQIGNRGSRSHNQPVNNNEFGNPLNNVNAVNNNAYNNPVNPNPVVNTNTFNNRVNDNNAFNNPVNNNAFSNPVNNDVFNNPGNNAFNNEVTGKNNAFNDNFQYQVNNENTVEKVANLINDVNRRLNNVRQKPQMLNNIGLTWDDDNGNVNNDWSMRQRPFSNAHSGALNNLDAPEILKTTLEALVGGREIQVTPITDITGNSYNNRGGGGVEKFFGIDRVVEGPHSYTRNQRRAYEKKFAVNTNRSYQRANQWSTNSLRRLDTDGSRSDFSKDFIDVFRDEY